MVFILDKNISLQKYDQYIYHIIYVTCMYHFNASVTFDGQILGKSLFWPLCSGFVP